VKNIWGFIFKIKTTLCKRDCDEMIGKKIQDAFNEQIKNELESYYLYLSMAAYFHSIGLHGMAYWMKAQASEEQGHAMRFFDHLKERNSRIELSALSQPKAEWASPLEVFQEAYQHERFITGKINDLVKLATVESDNLTAAILQWFMTEQVAVEASISKIAHTLKKLDSCGSGLEMIDQQLGTGNKRNVYYLNFSKAPVLTPTAF
jgi:ferritin